MYVNAYLKKLNLQTTEYKTNNAPDILTVDYPELMKQKALKAVRTQTDPMKLAYKMKRQ